MLACLQMPVNQSHRSKKNADFPAKKVSVNSKLVNKIAM